jgi:hypothetical protein
VYNSEGPISTNIFGLVFKRIEKKPKGYESLRAKGDELHFSILNRPSRDWVIGAVRFECGRDSFVVLLKKEKGSISIEIGALPKSETVKDFALSYSESRIPKGPFRTTTVEPRRRWQNESDQLLWNIPMRMESISVTTRKQMVSGESTNVITVDLVK